MLILQLKILYNLHIKSLSHGIEATSLAVEVVVIILVEVSLARSPCRGASSSLSIREPEVGSKSSGLLEGLAEHLVLLDIIVRH